MEYELVVVADPNDADYITSITKISEEELQEIIAVTKHIKKERHNWNTSEYSRDPSIYEMYPMLSEEQVEMFNDYIPYGEYGIHTIQSIAYYPVPEKTVLL